MESILKVGLGFVIQIRCIVYIIPQNLSPKFEMNIPLWTIRKINLVQ